MMMILILVMNQRVVAVRVKYSHQIIRTPEHVALIAPYMRDEMHEIEHILPTILSKSARYPYHNAETLHASFDRATQDTITGKYPVRDWLRFAKRIYICSGKSKDDSEFNTKIMEMKQLANYIEANKNEI